MGQKERRTCWGARCGAPFMCRQCGRYLVDCPTNTLLAGLEHTEAYVANRESRETEGRWPVSDLEFSLWAITRATASSFPIIST